MTLRNCLAVALAVALVACIAAAPADAGFKRLGASGFAFLKVAQGARAAAMGDAYAAVGDDASTVFWNPAGLAYVENREWAYTYTRWMVKSNLQSGVFALNNSAYGAFAVSFITFRPDAMEETTPFAPAGTGRNLDAGDMAIGVAYAKRLTERFSVGGHLQWVQETLDQDKATTLNISLGTLFYTGFRSSRIAMTLKNFGHNASVGTEYDQFLMPMVFHVTAAMEVYGQKQDPNRLTLSVENVYAVDYDIRAHLGAELWLQDMFALRAGYKMNYDSDTFSLGAGLRYPLKGKPIKVDFAYTNMGDLLDPALRLSVGMGF